jgi:hypothetical protein
VTGQHDPFAYRPPAEAKKPAFDAVASSIALTYDTILTHVPDGPDRTIAIRKLQEARMWANAAISFDGNSLPPKA